MQSIIPPSDSLMLFGGEWVCHTFEYTIIGFYDPNDFY